MKRKIIFVTNNYYHVFNRGVEKRKIFLNDKDFQRFLETLAHCLSDKRKPSRGKQKVLNKVVLEKPVEVVAYCLMPNHFHLLLKQQTENGIASYLQRVTNSYAKYFNTKYKREGSLFQGPFKSVGVTSDQQLIHLSRYIHLNSVVSGLTTNPEDYKWSSYNDYQKKEVEGFIDPRVVLEQFPSQEAYRDFTLDQIDYGKSLEELKHLSLE